VTELVAWFRRCYCLLLTCCAVLSLNSGCHSTDNPSTAGGVASSKAKPGSSWSLFPPEPKKVQTPSDFISLPRPQ